MAPTWQAARNGLTGDAEAVNQAAQVSQFLAAHGVIPVYAGNRVWTVATTTGGVGMPFDWIESLPGFDDDQPVILPGGVTAIGRVEVAVQAVGAGADLQVTLYPDTAGAPNTGSPLASTIVPAAHIAALGAAGSLATAGPLATSQSNTVLSGPSVTVAWTQPAVSANGSGTFATPVTAGNWTVFLGGFDATAVAAITSVSGVQYLGGGTVSGAVTLPALPQAAWFILGAATPDTMVAAGGTNTVGGLASVWTAPWDPVAGTLGAWSGQQALPAANVSGAMASWGQVVYVAGGAADGTTAHATAAVWYATVSGGQITAWTAGIPLPQPLLKPYLAVVGNWLIVAGGQNTAGTAQSATWYAAIGSTGVPGPWQAGPALPEPVYDFGPSWNLLVTDSAVTIVAGPTTGGTGVSVTQVLAVSPDGPGDEWQLQDFSLAAAFEFQAAAYPTGTAGQWEAFAFLLTSYASVTMYPVPMISVPLPATGLTPGNTYHVVLHQVGGDTTNNYVLTGEIGATTPPAPWQFSTRGSGGPWTTKPNRALMLNVYDQTPGGGPLHLWEDSGARVTSLVRAGSGSQLLGVLEATQFPSGAPEAVIGPVTQVNWDGSGTRPTGTVQLA